MSHHKLSLRSREALYGPPDRILKFKDFERYQVWMSALCQKKKFVLLGADMGMGKTAVCLHAIRAWLESGAATKVLIVAPLHVATNTWPDEIGVWKFSRPLKFSVVVGDAEERAAALRKKAQVYIINRENVVWMKRHFDSTKTKFPFDALVYDEASRLKSGKKRTGKTTRKDGTVTGNRMSEFGALCTWRDKFNHIVELTGTPAPNGVEDLWGPVYIGDGGQRLGRTKTDFYNRWFDHNQYTHTYTARPYAMSEILDRVKDCFYSLRSEDYLTLPPLKIIDRMVTLPDSAREKYNRLARQFVLEEIDVEAENAAVLIGKLLQLANGGMYVDADGEYADHKVEGGSYVKIHDEKLKEMDSIIAESGGKPILVAYEFKFDLERLKKRYPKARVYGKGRNDLRDWNDGKIQMLLVHPASVGHGLNFQKGSNICVWYGLTWSLELYLQFMKRLWRRGQKESKVFMYRILAEKTADVRVSKALESRGTDQQMIIDAAKVLV